MNDHGAWTRERLQQGDLVLEMVPRIGGRLMDIVFHGTSLLFQNPDLVGLTPDLDALGDLPTRTPHLGFPLWGGEKTWIAPDSAWPDGGPHPMLNSGPYTYAQSSPHAVTMESAVCPNSGLQIERIVTLLGSDSWSIRHQITNRGPKPKLAGVWSVAMTKRPARYFYLSGRKNPTTRVFGDPAGADQGSDGIGCIHCDGMQEFKLAAHPATGLSAARIEQDGRAVWLVANTAPPGPAQDYAHRHALEFYNSGHHDYGEIEWHSPCRVLAPGEALDFKTEFHLFLEDHHLTPTEILETLTARKGPTP